MHGGKSLTGPAAPGFKHGKYSKVLPVRLAAHYAEASRDPELMSLRQDISLVDARIIDILKRVDTGEAGSIWREAQAAMKRFRLEQAKNHVDGIMLAITQVERLMSQGAGDYAAWAEIVELIDARRKLVESESRRLRDAHETMTTEQAMTLLAVVVDVIRRHVTDHQALNAIAAELQALGHHHGNGHAGNGHLRSLGEPDA
jgi:hypothetical protein